MIKNTHVIYESLQAAENIWLASEYSRLKFDNVHYISNEEAFSNLETAILKCLLEHPGLFS